MTPLNEQIERKAKELAIIGDDNADWIAVARHVLRCEIEAEIRGIKFVGKFCSHSSNRIDELNLQLQRLKEE